MHLSFVMAVILVGASPFLGLAAPEVKITASENGGSTTLFIQTTDLLDATVGIEVSGKNLQVSAPMPYFVDTMGRASFPALILEAKDKQQPWNYKYKYLWEPGGRSGVADDYEYSPPFAAGTRHKIVQGYLGTFSHRECSEDQYAIDWEMPVGTVVCAAREGTVVAVAQQWNAGGTKDEFRNKANYIAIRHDDGTYGDYVHLQQNGAKVKVGETVRLGQPIGLSGNTGYSSAPHVHFCVYRTRTAGFEIKRETLPVVFRGVEARFIAPRAACSPTGIETAVVMPAAKLALQGIWKRGNGYIAIINGEPFGPGQKANVKVGQKKVEVLCREVRQNAVAISVDGKDEELKLKP